VEGGSYPVTIKINETIPPRTLSYDGKTVEIILIGDASEQTVSPGANGYLFIIESGVTLTLDNNLVLQGLSSNSASLVQVNSGGALVMNTGSKISGNKNATHTPYGGGVNVNGGTFTMNGGTISGNTSSSSSYSSYGGGVSVSGGTFTMNNGTISDNTSSSSYSYSYSYGGGVSVGGAATTFTMNNGTISNNTLSGSASYRYGGGVSVNGGTFTMSGGTVSGHTTAVRGGGVYVDSGTFIKQQSGGTIYGSDADDALKNTAIESNGYAVYVSSGSKKRNTTAGLYVTLDSTKTISEGGGWE
jgi:hypothetical protein